MQHVRIEGADPKPLGAPADWNPEEHGTCGALFVRREVNDGLHYMRSAWDVQTHEAMQLLAGAKVELGIAGTSHPVVQLGVGIMPPDFEPVMVARRLISPEGLPTVRVDMVFPHGTEGRRGYATCAIGEDESLSSAVACAVDLVEQLARAEGWVT
jgi:hypothetical protein